MSKENFTTITKELLHEHFYYANGILCWKKQSKNKSRNLNSECGSIHHTGYRVVHFMNKQFRIHRLIFLYHHGYLPKCIDHIDGNKLNNKIENLREATIKQNGWNRKLSSNNKTGIKGISWVKKYNKWQVYCKTNYKSYFLGYFDSFNDAKEKIISFRKEHHGEFARITNEF